MAFKGIITRKDVKTGVSLNAKIVTENKKKSARYTYPVTVASNGLSDAEACNIDFVTKKTEFIAQGAADLMNDLMFSQLGANMTNISYRIIDISQSSKLSTYLSENGIYLGCPSFGEEDAVGRIEITVSKGKEKIVGLVDVIIKAYTAESILANEDIVSKAKLWQYITGDTTANILKKGTIGLRTSWEPWSTMALPPSKTPISITYEVVDKLSMHKIIESPRINVNQVDSLQTLYKPTYAAISSKQSTLTLYGIDAINDNVSASSADKQYKIGGLTIKATLKLAEDASIVYTYDNVYSYSAIRNNTEVLKDLIDNHKVESENEGDSGTFLSTLFYVKNASTGTNLGPFVTNVQNATLTLPEGGYNYNTDQTIIIDATGLSEFKLAIVNGNYIGKNVKLPNMNIGLNELICSTNQTPVIEAYDGSAGYLDDFAKADIFIVEGNTADGADIVKIDFAQMKAKFQSNPTAVDFRIEQTINIAAYDSANSPTVQHTIFKRFHVNNIENSI